MYKLRFYASIITHNDKPAMMVRRIFTRKEDISDMVEEIIKRGEFRFLGKLKFRDLLMAVSELKRRGLL